MVEFTTRIFSEQGGQTIGCEVTVYSDQGDKIGNIAVTDAASITELQQRLAVIDETYFTEERLQAILANSQETNNINATSLNGFVSSDFAKVNQLSNYAPLSHNHTKNQITDLYNYQISASKYNVDIDTDVTITVKVTNQQGKPVVGVTVPVLKDNEAWKSGTTGVNGTFSLTYTADTWGLVMFSTNNNSLQVNVIGLKQVKQRVWSSSNNLTYTLYVDESSKIAVLTIYGSNINVASGISNYEVSGFVPSEYRPKLGTYSRLGRSNNILAYCWGDGGVGIANFYSSTLTGQNFGGQIEWHY